jgi:serine/threonine-protein kinase RsbT
MVEEVLYERAFRIKGGDFDKAGEVASQIKSTLQAAGIPPGTIRRVAIASFEAEMNVVIHAREGEIEFILTTENICITVKDQGPGIEDIELAMKEGYSTATDDMREKGFGAGMGLPNIKKSVDNLELESEVGVGTKLTMSIEHKQT